MLDKNLDSDNYLDNGSEVSLFFPLWPGTIKKNQTSSDKFQPKYAA